MINSFGKMIHYNIELSSSPTLSVFTRGSPRPTVCSMDTPSQTPRGRTIHAGRQSYGEQYYTHIADRLQIVLGKAIQNRSESHKGNQMHKHREVSVLRLAMCWRLSSVGRCQKCTKLIRKRDFSNCVSRVHLITEGFWLDQSLDNQPSLRERERAKEKKGGLIIGDKGPKGQLGSKGGYVRQDWGGETGEKTEDREREKWGNRLGKSQK